MIPCTLGSDTPESVLSLNIIEIIRSLDYFVVEKSKSARKFIKDVGHPTSQSAITVHQIDKHAPQTGIDEHIIELKGGRNIGFISEAGMPGIADPGSLMAISAHRQGITVKSLSGPNSMMLALAGSGLNGQHFCFHGYLPKNQGDRKKKLESIETVSSKYNQTQIFIETPYRNKVLVDDILKYCKQNTLLCLAANLTLEDEFLVTLPVKEWQKKVPNLQNKPTVFLLYAGNEKYLN
jgi:16S rRNA (cytidine1402-2'-O)-methyltransferase